MAQVTVPAREPTDQDPAGAAGFTYDTANLAQSPDGRWYAIDTNKQLQTVPSTTQFGRPVSGLVQGANAATTLAQAGYQRSEQDKYFDPSIFVGAALAGGFGAGAMGALGGGGAFGTGFTGGAGEAGLTTASQTLSNSIIPQVGGWSSNAAGVGAGLDVTGEGIGASGALASTIGGASGQGLTAAELAALSAPGAYAATSAAAPAVVPPPVTPPPVTPSPGPFIPPSLGTAASVAGGAATVANAAGSGGVDNVGSDWSSGDPSAMNPGGANGVANNTIDPSVITKIAQATGMTEAAVKALGASAIGALAGAVGADSKPAGTTTTVQDIPDWLKPYVTGNLDAAKKYMDANPQDNSLLAPASDQLKSTIAGDYLNSNPANPFYTGAMNYTNSSMDYLRPTAEGKYLNANPYIDAMYAKARDAVGTGIDSRFSSAGRYGSGAMAATLGTTFGNLATDIYGNNYANERTAMNNAGTTLIGADAAQEAARLAGANGLGANYNTARGQQLTASTAAPGFTADAATSPFAGYTAFSNLTKGLGTQTTSPYFTNPTGGALSGALAGYGLSKAFG